jgi:outer membrane receptor protein involved in Fe transport
MKCVGVARALVVLLVLGLAPLAADAQGVASLTGVVRDTSGGALPGATVQMEAVKGGRRFTQSDAQGRYAFKDMAPGAYRVTATLSSFTAAKADVTLVAGQAATKDFSLDFSYFANVTVTPQKREEQILDVPAAISAVGGDSIQDQGVTDLNQIAATVPGMSMVQSQAGSARVQIRGISSPQNLPTTGLYLDETSIAGDSAGSALAVQMIDLDRVEVLRGPQGTLYGAGSMGGTIKYMTKDPKLDALGLEFDSAAGAITDGAPTGRASLVVNLPLIKDQLAVRLVGGYERNASWVNYPLVNAEDVNGGDTKTLRIKTLWTPSEKFSASLLLLGQNGDYKGPNNADEDRTAPYVIEQPYESRAKIGNLILNFDAGPFTILSSTGYGKNKGKSANDFTSIFGPIYDLFGFPPGTVKSVNYWTEGDAEQWNQEIRFASKGLGAFTWTAGLYYRHATTDAVQGTISTPNPLPGMEILDLEDNQKSEQAALFGEANYAFSPKFAATLGLRGFRDKREQSGYLVSFGTPVPPPSHEDTFTSINPRVVLSWRPAEGKLFYASAAKGFRSGGFNNLPRGCTLPEAYDPETLWTYEVGSSVSVDNGRFVAQGAVFHNEWSDIQTLTTCPGLPIVQTANVGKASGTGVDLQLTIAASRALRFTVSGNYNDSKYDSTSVAHNEGDEIDYVSKYTLGLAMDWSFRWSPEMPGQLHVDYQSIGSYAINLRNYGIPPLESDVIGGLNARLSLSIGQVELSLFGKNLLDQNGAVQPAIPVGGVPSPVSQQPRTIGAGFGFRL